MGRSEKPQPVCGTADFLVALYLHGDVGARTAAQRLVDQERQLRRIATAQQRQIRERQYASVGDRLAGWFSGASARIPDDWLTRVLISDPSVRHWTFEAHLPAEVRQSVTEFSAARWQVYRLSAPPAVARPSEAIAQGSAL
jgi:hypothetical protein